MSTAVDYHSSSPANIRSRHHNTTNTSIELTDLNNPSPPPPAYDEQLEVNPAPSTHHDVQPPSTPFLHLQIETAGKPIMSFPLPPKPDPIPVYLVDHFPESEGNSSTTSSTPRYLSLRPTRGSGSCYLVTGDNTTPSSEPPNPLSTTTYRFGPGRPPRVRLFSPHFSTHRSQEPAAETLGTTEETEHDEDSNTYSAFDMLSSGLFTRAVRFRPPRLLRAAITTATTSSPNSNTAHYDEGEGGSITDAYFEWRYATKKERKSFPSSTVPDSLLILSKTTIKSHNHGPSSAKKETATTVPFARFIRSAELRTRGSTVSSAGNGGRLQILDLGEAGYGEECKVEREMVEVMVVTTCLVMLKREVDRRRGQQIVMIAGGAGS